MSPHLRPNRTTNICTRPTTVINHWSHLCHNLLENVASVPRKDQLSVLMEANAYTAKGDRGESLEYAQVVGPYGRDVLNNNGGHLVRTAADAGMTIVNTFFSSPNGRQQSTYVSSKGDAWHLDYILTRHADRRLTRKITVSIVASTIRLRRRFTSNRPKRPANRHPRIDRQMLVNNDDTHRGLARAIDSEFRECPGSPNGEVDCMMSMFTKEVLRTAIRLLPPGEHRRTDGVRMRACAGSWLRHGAGRRKYGRRGGR